MKIPTKNIALNIRYLGAVVISSFIFNPPKKMGAVTIIQHILGSIILIIYNFHLIVKGRDNKK